ncbi:type II secretion system protein [Lentisphaera profundi]|uniref:Type II secretion system protein n=1 Tax=Lentisphaera profundi TaxID=1658616 RepID=A0ABY7W074_9BACT|nr:type II secretion system protein [Lentisphaera profundi]WDE98379.1 type II secretion system protein [Lentisphaera profundi]
MKTRKLMKRFSIFEVLAVLVILSILASLIFNSMSTARDEAKRAVCLNNLKQIQNVVEVYRKDHRATPRAISEHDFSFAAEYVDENSIGMFRCPGDDQEVASLDSDIFLPSLNKGTSYIYIPADEDVLGMTELEMKIEDINEFLIVYDKDSRFHNGRFNVLYLHGTNAGNGGIATTRSNQPNITPPNVPNGTGDQGPNNNGWGSGDQAAPGNSGSNNRAENDAGGRNNPVHGTANPD